MVNVPSSSPKPTTPKEIRENFAKAITIFAQHCKTRVTTLKQADLYLQDGLTFISGTYKVADVRLYPPQPREVSFDPDAALPTLFFNLGNKDDFEELGEIFQAEDLHITIRNIR